MYTNNIATQEQGTLQQYSLTSC